MSLDVNVFFCAGFFEADGCVSIKKSGVCLGFYNDNKHILENIRDVLSVGNNILPREKPKGGTSYTLTICKRKDVIRIIKLFLSCGLVTVKRDKLAEALTYCLMLGDKAKRQAEEQARIDSFIREHPELSGARIGVLLGLSRTTICSHRTKIGLKQYIQHKMSDADKKLIIDHPELSNTILSKRLGVSRAAIYKFRKKQAKHVLKGVG